MQGQITRRIRLRNPWLIGTQLTNLRSDLAPLLLDLLGMNRSKMLLLTLSLGTETLISACGKQAELESLGPVVMASPSTYEVKVNFCTPESYIQKQRLKTIIILDHSGSNKANYSFPNGVIDPNSAVTTEFATDPDGTLRYGSVTSDGTLLNYLQSLPANDPNDPIQYFARINFSSTPTSVFPREANGQPFTSDISSFFSQMQSESVSTTSLGDGGNTNYTLALDEARALIERDILNDSNCAKATAKSATCPTPGVEVVSTYTIVFMSDGSPITSITFPPAPQPPKVVRQTDAEILASVGSIMNLVSGNSSVAGINLFTIYYHHPTNIDSGASELLKRMAKKGNGVSYDVSKGETVDYQQFRPPERKISYSLVDVMVTNPNLIWWQGNYYLDGDNDGLPDALEANLGYDNQKRASLVAGVSDRVHYELDKSGVMVNAGQCGSNPDLASDPNGLNDCEKKLLSNTAGIGKPDSNGDFITDWIEFINGVAFQFGTSPAVNKTEEDGLSIYEKIKYSLPVDISLNEMPLFKKPIYTVLRTSATEEKQCFNVQINDFPVAEGAKNVRVDLFMRADLLKGTILYERADKSFPSDAAVLEINDWTVEPTIWRTFQ